MCSSDPDFNRTKMLNNFQGYGAFSIIKLECLHLPEVIPGLREQYNITNTHCVTGKTQLNIYNTLVASPILALFDRLIVTDPEKNLRFHDTPLVSRIRAMPAGGSVEALVTQSIDYER